MADSIWWTKMLHKEDFCEHFCEMSDKEIVDDIRKSIASFMKQRDEGNDFGAKMVHKAKLRIDAVHDVRSDEESRADARARKNRVRWLLTPVRVRNLHKPVAIRPATPSHPFPPRSRKNQS